MNARALTEVFVCGLSRQILEWLIPGLLVAVVVLVVAILMLIFCLCREEARLGRKKAADRQTDKLVPI
jgi:hypothetical protein